MKRLACLILALALLLALTACGEPDPNAGVYVAVTAEMSGIRLDIDSVYEGGLSFELKDGGRAVMTMDGEDYNLRWKLDGEAITITAADTELSGTLADGTMVLDISGVSVTLIRSA
ncbi:MAG: hypothetical protein IJK35_05950 [Oscillospiraceae bacterium]|nr:hypothetical protein [Oscillospiraceae bacterium]